MIELKEYQENAIEDLKKEVDKLLDFSESKVCVFKSPTGSGKTLMVAEFLKRLVTHRTDNKKLAFIWISVNKLHDQSKDSLERYYEDSRIIICSNFEDLEDKQIGENEMLFFNWQSINKKGNLYIRENEQDNNLSSIITNTKDEEREIVLIIDESHHTAKAEKSREVIDAINPQVTLEVSATPQIRDISGMVEVDFQDVKEEGMIKKEIAINLELDKSRKVDGKSTDELVIESALRKRRELIKSYQKENSNINPLVLIQLPDKKAGVIDRQEDIIKTLKDKFNITTENRKLAIYLSDKESKVNLENIEKPDNETEVLIFKQAIAIGWDCPRASILVLFRDWKSITFSIQTVGRIMRMPEFKHYDEDNLNNGYVFTNLLDVHIAEDIAKDYLTIYEAKRRNDIYKNIDLNSNYLKRQREKTRLSGEFSKIYLSIAKKEKLKDKINQKISELVNSVIVDGKIINLDKIQIIEPKNRLDIRKTEKELQYHFDIFIRSVCTPFAPADSSGRIKTALYKFFEKELKIDDYSLIQKLILGKENNQFLVDSINNAKEEYKIKVIDEVNNQRESDNYVWNIPEYIPYNARAKEVNYNKSIMRPHYSKSESKPEIEFQQILEDKDNNVVWWYKNGETEKKYFSVEYVDKNGVKRGFYVDFIVLTKDGRIGLFDTKGGRTAEDAKEKAEALQKYIQNENKNRKDKLWGGIVVLQAGSCRYNDSDNYYFDEGNLGNDWKFLTFK
jgi:type III restriction enzyme